MQEYSATLTGGPFLYNECKIIGKYLLDGEDPILLRKRNISDNLIQYKKVNSISRVNSPIFTRLLILSKEQLDFFVKAEIQQSKYMLVYAIMKTDRLVKEFIRELYYDKLLMNDQNLEKYEVTKWFNTKYDSSEFLRSRSESTQYKLQQVMLQIMTSSGLLKKNDELYEINRPLLSKEFVDLVRETNDYEYAKSIGGLVWEIWKIEYLF